MKTDLRTDPRPESIKKKSSRTTPEAFEAGASINRVKAQELKEHISRTTPYVPQESRTEANSPSPAPTMEAPAPCPAPRPPLLGGSPRSASPPQCSATCSGLRTALSPALPPAEEQHVAVHGRPRTGREKEQEDPPPPPSGLRAARAARPCTAPRRAMFPLPGADGLRFPSP